MKISYLTKCKTTQRRSKMNTFTHEGDDAPTPFQRETVWETDARVRPLPVCKPILRAADQRADLSNAATVFRSDDSAMQLLVGLTAPFRIHGATNAIFDMFELSAATCISRSLGLVQGPETNVKLLFSLFEMARVGRGANAMIVFYSSSGNGHLFHVAVEPQSSKGDASESCIISLELVQATPLKNAVLPDGRAKVIVSADQSRTVHVSPEFEKMYGYLWSEIVGRTLGFITGPNTNMALLLKLLNSARNGHSETDSFFTNTRAGDEILTVIQVKPVVDRGVVSHMVVVFSIVGDIAGHCLQASSGGKSRQVETSTETRPEVVSEDALEEMLVRKHSQSQQARSAHLHSREQHLHHGKTSSEAAKAFSRIKWRQVPVKIAHSRMCSFQVPYQCETVWETDARARPILACKPNSARNGHSETDLFFTNTRAGDEILTVIQVKPVVDRGVVSHMVVVFSIVEDIAGHCLDVQTNDGELGTDELHVERLVEMSGHLCVGKAPPSSSEASSGGKSRQVETSTETRPEVVSEDALEEMLAHELSQSQQARSTHLNLKKQHLHHGQTSSEAAEAFSRIKWRQVPVKIAHSRTVQLPVNTYTYPRQGS